METPSHYSVQRLRSRYRTSSVPIDVPGFLDTIIAQTVSGERVGFGQYHRGTFSE
jgi:hypothetical protein